jgi:4-phytase/acid phosphatase
MGAYYRAYYARSGLISGQPEKDGDAVAFRADSDQRTIETARDLAAGLLPGTPVSVSAKAENRPDPLFSPVKAHLGNFDADLASAALLGRIGGDQRIVFKARAAQFANLERVLAGGSGKPSPGKKSILEAPMGIGPEVAASSVVGLRGPLGVAMRCVDNFILEYAEGMPMSDVGWGRLSRAELTELIDLHSLYFNLTQATFYPAQVQASNLASHLLRTLEQGASGRAVPGAIGGPANRVVVLVGHDTNIVNLAGLLNVSWWLDGTQRDPVLPGGALVFELRRGRGEAVPRVRLYYVCQTLEAMRAGDAPSLEHPPLVAPMFIPGCSRATPGYDAPLDRVEALFGRVIDPAFVTPTDL